jgi:hypothetical protein
MLVSKKNNRVDEVGRSKAYNEAVQVVEGCKTREQLLNARKYVDLFYSLYGDFSEKTSLWDVVQKVDKRLFPFDYDKVIHGY